jgi:hypothetical protein
MRKAIAAVIVSAAASAAALGIASSAAASTSTEHFSLISVSTNESHIVYSVIATGRFTAGGTAAMTGKKVTLRFQHGTITLNVTNRHHTVTSYPGCLQTEASSGTYTIAGGTGAYTGISGSGKAAVHVTFVENTVNGTCSDNPAAIQAIITASGPVSLP